MHIHRGRLPGEAELHGGPAEQPEQPGAGVLRERLRQGAHRPAQAGVRFYFEMYPDLLEFAIYSQQLFLAMSHPFISLTREENRINIS